MEKGLPCQEGVGQKIRGLKGAHQGHHGQRHCHECKALDEYVEADLHHGSLEILRRSAKRKSRKEQVGV